MEEKLDNMNSRKLLAEKIEYAPFYKDDSDIELIAELYCVTFLDQNYTLKDKEEAISNINKHAGYEGFKGVKAKNNEGDLIGFTYGYTSLRGQFYHEKLLLQLSEDDASNWLADCFEYVELAVHPNYKQNGIASTLHDMLLDNIPLNTAILTTGIKNTPAINLYKKKGWHVIKENAPVVSADFLQMIMVKKLVQ